MDRMAAHQSCILDSGKIEHAKEVDRGHQIFTLHRGQLLKCRGEVFVVPLEDIGWRLDRLRNGTAVRFELSSRDSVHEESFGGGDMPCELKSAHRLGIRFPGAPIRRNGLDHAAGGGVLIPDLWEINIVQEKRCLFRSHSTQAYHERPALSSHHQCQHTARAPRPIYDLERRRDQDRPFRRQPIQVRQTCQAELVAAVHDAVAWEWRIESEGLPRIRADALRSPADYVALLR